MHRPDGRDRRDRADGTVPGPYLRNRAAVGPVIQNTRFTRSPVLSSADTDWVERRAEERVVTASRPGRSDFEPANDRAHNFAGRKPPAADPGLLLAWLHQGRRLIALSGLVFLAAGLAYAMLATPRHVARTTLLIDPSGQTSVSDGMAPALDQMRLAEVEAIGTLMKSEPVLSRVVETLALNKDSEFTAQDPLSLIISLTKAGPDNSNRKIALRSLADRVTVHRQPDSFVVELGVWTEDSGKSVAIANALTTAIEQELARLGADRESRAGTSFDAQAEALRKDVTEAEKRLAALRSKLGLYGTDNPADDTADALSAARQALADAETRQAAMKDAIAAKTIAQSAAFDSATMADLRQQLLTLEQDIAAMQLKLGSKHPRLVNATAQRQSVLAAINDEARDMLKAAAADVDLTGKELARLDKALAKDRSKPTDKAVNALALRDLEREVQAKTVLYDNFLANARALIDRQVQGAASIHVLSGPTPPDGAIWPPSLVTMVAAATSLGLVTGMLLAVMRGYLGHRARLRRRPIHPARR